MCWQDMTRGEAYVLATDPSIKVTLLDTPDDVRSRAQVRVRFETGVAAGRVTDIPRRRIGAPCGRERAPKPVAARRAEIALQPVLRAPRVGDSVTWAEMSELIWTVEEIDETNATATIRTVTFERPSTRIVELDRLQVRTDLSARREHRGAEHGSSRPPSPSPIDPAVDAAERLRPMAPVRELDELMTDVYFSDRCLRAYDRHLGAGEPGPAVERLREEVRRKGYLLHESPARAGEYARVRVNGRFDIVLAHKPTHDAPVTIEALCFRRRESPRRRRPRRRAA